MPTSEPAKFELFATAPRGAEDLVAAELEALGIKADARAGGVAFHEDLAAAYRVCLWSRIASRVLLVIHRFDAGDAGSLYDGCHAVDWCAHLDPDATFVVDYVDRHSRIVDNTRFGAMKVKDALVDRFRADRGRRPSVDRSAPDLRINVFADGPQVTVSVDLTGAGLHRRGLGRAGGAAPLKENLAAAVLTLAGAPEVMEAGGPVVDPMCGSGTLLIEAAMMALRRAPGLRRRQWGFAGWRGHDAALFERVRAEAQAAERPGPFPPFVGFDRSPQQLELARANAVRAGVSEMIRLERCALGEVGAPEGVPGLLVTNPPYGERLGDEAELTRLYEALGDVMKRRFLGYRCAVLSGSRALDKHIALRPDQRHPLFNGAIECRLLCYSIAQTAPKAGGGPSWRRESEQASMFENRLRKNMRRLRRWAHRAGVTCYRVYDADIPEYNVAVDLYEGAALVQEYRAPRSVDPDLAATRLRDVLAVASRVLEIEDHDVHLRVRRPSTNGQYEKKADIGELREVHEGGLRFLVNLTDYLDTGLFLDHRQVREMIRQQAGGGTFLNLFSYTCTATAYAVAGGARSSTSVDLSNTYLSWGRQNLALNGADPRCHELVQADCMAWLDGQRAGPYDLIFVAPPIRSESKRARSDFDVRRDYPSLVRAAARLLAPKGRLLFSHVARGLELDPTALSGLELTDITEQTRPQDFPRGEIHRTYVITKP